MQFYFTVNVGRKLRNSSWCLLIECIRLIWGLLNTGFTVEYLGRCTALPIPFSKIGFMFKLKLILSVSLYISRIASIAVPFARSRHFLKYLISAWSLPRIKKLFSGWLYFSLVSSLAVP